jgi:hypothetical protein
VIQVPVSAFSDSDWAELGTLRSTTGFVVLLIRRVELERQEAIDRGAVVVRQGANNGAEE